VGTVAGALATAGPSDRLLTMLNEPPAGTALLGPLIAGWAAAVAIPALAAAWPAWRAAARPPVELLRGAELRTKRVGPALLPKRWTGLTVLGGRLAGARPARWVATALTLGLSTAFVLLMLAIASALSALETDPQELGKRYQVTASLPATAAARVRRIPGVEAVAPRYDEEAVDSFSLGETIDVIAYPGDHTRFEAPPLAAGRRLQGSGQAEVGVGLADALGLSPGSVLAIQLQSGSELRLRVAGLVSSLDDDGRVAYVPASALLAADPQAPEELAVRLQPNADQAAVLRALGPSASPAAGATARGVPLVNTLRAILTAVAVLDGLVCLYALLQACALTVQERRRTLAVLRACGAGGPAVRRLLAGAVMALVIPAVAVGIVLEQLVLAPALSRLAASYATLPISASQAEIAAVLAGAAVAGAIAVVWVGRQVARETVVAGLTAT
jgi:ABC-type lipoprotein release transport system permease subunit